MIKYVLKGNNIIKDGHTMFLQDVVKDLNRKSFIEERYKSLIDALIPSAETKAHHIGKYSFYEEMEIYDYEEDCPITENIKFTVPWTTIKKIMKEILKYT